MQSARTSGILLHPTSLPVSYGIGDLGDAAYRFVDWLVAAKQSLWQVLPLGPPGGGWSPYDARSSFAGNHLLIALEPLVELGLLTEAELPEGSHADRRRADFLSAVTTRQRCLRLAFDRFQNGATPEFRDAYRDFREREAAWLDDYALFQAIHTAHQGAPWYEWEAPLARRQPEAIQRWRQELDASVELHRFLQFLFSQQWTALKAYANERGVRIIGDIPICVAHDSADVWAHQELFTLDASGRVAQQAGVPPDYFSATGQLWGNPCYRWDVLKQTGYAWWIERFRRALELTDLVRVDHFRGFVAGWQVPAGEATAIAGEWVPGPGADFFEQLDAALGHVEIIVEDLGIITEDVHALRTQLGYPGMRVLQFAFGGGSDNPYLPHNHERNTVVYTGTHDNDTTLGWYRSASPEVQSHVQRYFGAPLTEISWDFIRCAFMSVADTAIVPLQDVLGLGSEARMNVPGTAHGNWGWRFLESELTPERGERLARMATLYGRNGG